MSFKDEIRLTIHSGKGGFGLASFASSRRKIRGGPNGGDGGDGGDVLLKVNSRLDSLSHLNPNKTYKAENGGPGLTNKKKGKRGAHLIIEVPLHTYLIEGNKKAQLKKNSNYTILKGGHGGKGNVHFKTSTNHAPTKTGSSGKGQVKNINLEIRYPARVVFMSLTCLDMNAVTFSLSKNKKSNSSKYLRMPLFKQSSLEWSFVELPKIQKTSLNFLKHALYADVLIHVCNFAGVETTLKDVKRMKELLGTYNKNLLKKEFLLFLLQDVARPSKAELGNISRELQAQNINCFYNQHSFMEYINRCLKTKE